MCGVHAQVMSAAEISLWARVADITPDHVRAALWQRRSLVKTWCMRGTLHLLAASEAPFYVAALRTRTGYRRAAWLKYYGLTSADADAIIAAVGSALDGRCLTREELADEVTRRVGLPVRDKLVSGWGDLLKPAAYQGNLCFGPSRGQNVAFVRPDQWLGGWHERDSGEALKEVLRHYLAAYGPATHQDFARWWGTDAGHTRALLRSLAEELEEVEVEGSRTWALPADAERMRALPPPDSVRLLPNFDCYVLGSRPREELVPGGCEARVFRAAGWISPVLLIDGRVAGVWEQRRRGDRVAVRVEPFASLSADRKERVEEEAARLGAFLGGRAEVAFSGPP